MKKVLVTGATGRTGSIVFQKLRDRKEWEVIGFAQTASLAHLRSRVGYLQRWESYLRLLLSILFLHLLFSCSDS